MRTNPSFPRSREESETVGHDRVLTQDVMKMGGTRFCASKDRCHYLVVVRKPDPPAPRFFETANHGPSGHPRFMKMGGTRFCASKDRCHYPVVVRKPDPPASQFSETDKSPLRFASVNTRFSLVPCFFAVIFASTFLAVVSAQAQYELGTVSVVVKDDAGKPVPGATVQCVNWNDFFPRTEPLTPREQATSDASGRAVFDGVTIGQAFVRVISGDLGGWFRVQKRGSDIPLVIGVGHSTQIVIRDESGRPLQDVLASADGCIPFGETDKDGLVIIRNHGIGYTPQLFFAKKGYAWEAVHLPFNPEKVLVTLKQGVQVEGVVLDPEGRPVPDAEIMWNRQRMLYSDGKGCFTFPEVAIGSKATLDVNAWKAQPPLIGEASVTVSAPPIEKVTITLKPAPQSPAEKPGATLRGKVLHAETGKPVMASILLEHSPQFEWPDEAATTGEDGRFTIEHVEGDRVWICAAPGDPTLYTVGGLIEVDLGKTASKEIAIQVNDGCALRGRVVTEDGEPVKSAQVMFNPMGPYYRAIWTNPEGRFVIPGLDGVGIAYKLSVSDQLQRQATLEVGPMAKGEIRSDLELRMPKSVF